MRRSKLRTVLCAGLLGLVATPAASAEIDGWIAASERPLVLRVPVEGELTSTFGPRWGRMHHGIDIAFLHRPGIVAAARGTVTGAGWIPNFGGYGITVTIDHGDGRETLYAHLSSIRVQPGQVVTPGEWIGNGGCTGTCTGRHLHFELRLDGIPVDPVPYLTPFGG